MPKETQCPKCRGTGGRYVPYTDEEVDDEGRPVIKFRWENCPECMGRGTKPA